MERSVEELKKEIENGINREIFIKTLFGGDIKVRYNHEKNAFVKDNSVIPVTFVKSWSEISI